jgi:hypothetical protein
LLLPTDCGRTPSKEPSLPGDEPDFERGWLHLPLRELATASLPGYGPNGSHAKTGIPNRNTARNGCSKSLILKRRKLPNPGDISLHICGLPLSPRFWVSESGTEGDAVFDRRSAKTCALQIHDSKRRKRSDSIQNLISVSSRKAQLPGLIRASAATHTARVLCANRARHVRIDGYHIGDEDTPHTPWNLIAS